MSESPGYNISLIQKDDHKEVMNLLRRTYFIDEPLNKKLAIYIPEIQPCPELEEFCSSLHEGLSFKAVDSNGKIVGVVINESCPITEQFCKVLLQRAEASTDPKFKKILYIVARSEEGSRLWEKFPDDKKLVQVKVAATDAQWRRRGIMNALINETEKMLKEQGVRLMRLDTSSAYSAKSAERMGFTNYYKVRYTDIQMNGEPLVVPDPPHEYDCVYIKTLY